MTSLPSRSREHTATLAPAQKARKPIRTKDPLIARRHLRPPPRRSASRQLAKIQPESTIPIPRRQALLRRHFPLCLLPPLRDEPDLPPSESTGDFLGIRCGAIERFLDSAILQKHVAVVAVRRATKCRSPRMKSRSLHRLLGALYHVLGRYVLDVSCYTP